MSAPRIQASRALAVQPNDDVNIPYPNVVVGGSVSGVTPYQLKDISVDFITLGIKTGDTVWNVTTSEYAYVTGVFTNYLELSLDIFTLVGTPYAVYQGVNSGCMLYVGSSGDISVETCDGDQVTFAGVNAGQFLPVQVVKVLTGTTASKILALW